MDPLASIDGIAELIRRKVSAEASAKNNLQGIDKAIQARQRQQIPQRPTTKVLQNKIVGMIDAIDSEDPKRNQKAMRIFVENVLIWQFGDDLLNDPSFSTLVDDVGTALSSQLDIYQLLRS